MSAFVILSIALAVVILVAVFIAARQLIRAVKKLTTSARRVQERLSPLTDSLAAEMSVTGAETAALSESVARMQAERAQRRRRREGVRLRRKQGQSRAIPGIPSRNRR